jgi:hypothetical protein
MRECVCVCGGGGEMRVYVCVCVGERRITIGVDDVM